MSNRIVKTQAELDALPDKFDTFTIIEIHGGTSWDRIIVKKQFACARVEARDSSHVEARGSSHVVARDSSHVVARDSSHVEARDSSHVVARGSSHVEARGSSHVEAWDSSHVVARDSSHVEARGSSHVVAWGSSHVVARGSVAIHNHSACTTLELGGFVVAWLISKAAKITRHGKSCRTVTPKRRAGVDGWLDEEAVKLERGFVTLFKRVSSDLKTQEGTPNETTWAIGAELVVPGWNPKGAECGAGKFHACGRTYFCDEFRSKAGDRYIAIKVAKKDLYAWPHPSHPHKIAFRAGVVLHECDKAGRKITVKPATAATS